MGSQSSHSIHSLLRGENGIQNHPGARGKMELLSLPASYLRALSTAFRGLGLQVFADVPPRAEAPVCGLLVDLPDVIV